jgi:hypothetical protein
LLHDKDRPVQNEPQFKTLSAGGHDPAPNAPFEHDVFETNPDPLFEIGRSGPWTHSW